MPHTLRPLSLAELLDRTFFYYRRHFLLFVGISALPNLLALTFGIGSVILKPDVGVTILGGLAWLIVMLVTKALSQGATVVAVSQIQLDRETNVSQAFDDIRSRLGDLLVVMLHVGVRAVIGFICLIVPGIILTLMYSLAIPVVVLERTTPREALSRSADLTKGHRGRIFLIYCLIFVIIMIGSMLWQVPTTVAIRVATGSIRPDEMPAWARILTALGNFVTQSLFDPIGTIALALVYYDERVRKEAFDLTHMLQQLDAAAPSPVA